MQPPRSGSASEDVMLDGVRVERMRPEQPSGNPPIILVHGGCHGSWVWRNFQPYLAERGWETHALNWYGHYGSRALDRPAFLARGLAGMVEEVSVVVRALAAPPIVVGHSMGGMVAQKFAETVGGVRALVLLASVAPRAAGAAPKDLGPDPDTPWGPPPFEVAKRLFFPENDEAEARELYGLLCPESPRCVFEATQSPPEVDAARVACPVLSVGGETDVLVPAAVAERTARLYGGASKTMAGRGHGLPIEPRWAKTAAHVHAWLEALPTHAPAEAAT